MITPAYSPTATERVLPRLALDFTTATLDARVTVTRALNTATRVNSSGFIETVNANLPRFDYDPVSLACKGLLIEESRANLLAQSNSFNTGSWTVANATITGGATASPDGTTNASKLAENTTSSTDHPLYTPGATTVTAGTAYTETFFLKKAERTWAAVGIFDGAWLRAFFDLANGTVGTVASGLTATITPFGNGFYRCSVTRTMTTTAAYAGVWTANANNSFSYAGTVGSGIFVYGAQLEAGAFATSYIPTTTTSLTRNLDVVLMTGTNFSSWYNATEGTFLVQYVTPGTDPDIGAFAVTDGTASNALYHYATNGLGRFVSTVSGSTAGVIGLTGATAYSGKFAACYGGATIIATENAKTPVSAANSGIPVVNQIQFGAQSNGARLNGCVSKFFYWPQKFTSAQLQANSK